MSENPQAQNRSSEATPGKKQPYLPISRQIKELWVDFEMAFKAFTLEQYPGVDVDFWSSLSINLQALRDVRDKAVHPEDRGNPKEKSISYIYHKFLGIGQPGILPELLKLSSFA